MGLDTLDMDSSNRGDAGATSRKTSSSELREEPKIGIVHYNSTSSTASAISGGSVFGSRTSDSELSPLSDEDEMGYRADGEGEGEGSFDGFSQSAVRSSIGLDDFERARSLTPQPKRMSWQAVMREKAMMRRSASIDFPSPTGATSSTSPSIILRSPRRANKPASTRCLSTSDENMRRLPACTLLLAGLKLDENRGCRSAPSSPCLSPPRTCTGGLYGFSQDSTDSATSRPSVPGSLRAGGISFPLTVSPDVPRRKNRSRTATAPALSSPSPGSPLAGKASPFSLKKLRRSLG